MQAKPGTNTLADQPSFAMRYPYYALALLFIINCLNFLDRQLPFILGEAIKKDLQLSDTDLGILGGLTFGIVYSLLGIPIARWADRRSQIGILSAAVFAWSAMTAMGAFAQNFLHLALARVGVALGEAGAAPCSHAVISNLFGPERRARALALFTMGLPIGTMVGLFLGGTLVDQGGWRFAMLVLGVPGIAMSLLIVATIRLPRRHPAAATAGASTFATMGRLLRNPTYRLIVLAMIAYGAAYSSFQTFQPSMMRRQFGLSFAEIGFYLGMLQGVLGAAAILLGGFGGDWLARRDPRWRLWLPAGALLLSAPLFALAQFAAGPMLCVAALAIPVATLSLIQPPVFAVVQEFADENARATTTATLFFFLTIFGVSTGGLVTGFISDRLHELLGNRGLPVALSLTGAMFLLAAIFMFAAARTYPKSRAF